MEYTTIRNKTNNTNEKKRYIIEHHEPHCLQPERIQEIHATLGKQKPRETKQKKNFLLILFYRHKNTHVAEAF